MSPKAGVECTVSSECWLAGVMRWAAGGDGMGLPWRAKKSENHVCERCGLGGALWWRCNTMSCAVDDTPPTWGFPPHTCGVHQWYIPCSKDMYTYSIQCRLSRCTYGRLGGPRTQRRWKFETLILGVHLRDMVVPDRVRVSLAVWGGQEGK